MADKSIKPAKPDKAKPEHMRPVPVKPIPVTPAKNYAHSAHCVRCECPLTKDVNQVRAVCMSCNLQLLTMHAASEYTMARKTYYIPSQEGTSLQWLLDHGYEKDIILPPKKRVQEPALVNST